MVKLYYVMIAAYVIIIAVCLTAKPESCVRNSRKSELNLVLVHYT